MKRPIRTSSIALAIATAIATAPLPAAANLLYDGAFDLNSPFTSFGAIVTPFTPGQWAVENANNVTATSGVTPASPERMLQMFNDGLTATQAGQVVAVGPGVNVTMSALFTTDPTVSGAIAEVLIGFYGATWGSGTPISSASATLNLDANNADWESLSVSALSPAGTQWALVQVAYSDASIGDNAGYVDNASLVVAPEPGTWAMMILGFVGAGLAGRRYARKTARA